MRVEQEVRPGSAAGDGRDHVADARTADEAILGKRAAIDRFMNLRLKAERPELGDQALADGIVGCGVHRMRTLVPEDTLQPRQRPVRVELTRSSVRGR